MTQQLEPPVAPRRPRVISAHGDDRRDDWYWLQDREDPEVLAILRAENEFTASATAHLRELEEHLYESMQAKIQLTSVTLPAAKGEWAYYTRTRQGSEYSLLCRRRVASPPPSEEGPDPDEVVMLDENELASGCRYFDIGDLTVSPNQRLLARATDFSGAEVMVVEVRDLATGADLPDKIEGAYYGLAFAADNETLFYTRPDASMRPFQVWRHRLGDDASMDALVLEEEDERFSLGVGTTKDGAFVVLSSDSAVTSERRLIPASLPTSEPVVVATRRQDVVYSIEHHHGELLLLSNDSSENFTLYRAPVESPGPEHWTVLLAGRDDIRLEYLDVLDGWAVVGERGHASTAIHLLPLTDRGSPHRIEAEEASMVALDTNLDFHAATVRFQRTNLVTPKTLYSYDLETKETLRLWREPAPGHDPERYRTERRWASSPDGTPVPITVAFRVDRPRGPGPCVLNGYGAYESSVDPTYRTDRPIHPLLDHGVLFAIAHVRGGGELGRHWYLDGKLQHKHHSFEDFVAVARHFVDEGLTSPEQLAIMGRSAGGLLVGAAANLAPDLFSGVVAEVPFVDCLTTMLDPALPLTVPEQEEWGDPIADEDAYRWIKAYSPYDNVGDVAYPRMLVTAGLNDPRVSYFEPAKWVQKLRAAHPANGPRVLLRVELSAGHTGASGRYQVWRQRSHVLAFLLETTGASRTAGDPGTRAVAGGGRLAQAEPAAFVNETSKGSP